MVWALRIKTPYLYNIGAEPLDGDFQKVDVIDRTPDGGTLPGGMTSGRPVHAEHMPTKMRWGNARYKIPDFDDSWCVNVSERSKAIIEQFEPHTHQFFPAEYYNKTKQLLETRYFLIVCNRIDSLDHDKTTMVFIVMIMEPTGFQCTIWWRGADHILFLLISRRIRNRNLSSIARRSAPSISGGTNTC